MKKLGLVLFCGACSSSPSTTDGGTFDAAGDSSDDVVVDVADAGQTDPLITARPYALRVPTGYDGTPTPLLVMLHGFTSSGAIEESYLKFGSVQKTFLYAYPDGLKDPQGRRFWNADDACCNFYGNPVDDVAYIDAIIEDVASKYNLDRKRVFVFGHSNGGFMAHRLACDLSPKIAAIGSLAGAVWNDPSKCKPSSPVAVLQIHGDADQTILYTGGTLVGVPYPSATTTVATWSMKNPCTGTLTDTAMTLDLEAVLSGAETTIARYTCSAGAVELWTIKGGGHVPSFQPTFASIVYDFFAAHPKP